MGQTFGIRAGDGRHLGPHPGLQVFSGKRPNVSYNHRPDLDLRYKTQGPETSSTTTRHCSHTRSTPVPRRLSVGRWKRLSFRVAPLPVETFVSSSGSSALPGDVDVLVLPLRLAVPLRGRPSTPGALDPSPNPTDLRRFCQDPRLGLFHPSSGVPVEPQWSANPRPHSLFLRQTLYF